MSTQQTIRIGQSTANDPQTAVKEFYAAVHQPNMELVLFFCSSQYNLDAIAKEMNELFPNMKVIGCTTAGEIGPSGYIEHSLSGVSFSSDGFTVAAGHLNDIKNINYDKGQEFANNLLQHLEARAPSTNSENSFAFLLVDGLSLREEQITHILQDALGEIALFGGSAGDDLQFKQTWIFADGAFHTDSVALVLVNTIYPFKLFKSQHFVCGNEKLVVTQADPERRIVNEINGYPAVEEYARIVNTQVDKLDPKQFSATPLVIRINGVDYVRSIQKANPDGSLKFYCAIDNGLVFMAAHGIDLIRNIEQTFQDIKTSIGTPQLVLACDCILRNLEMQREGLKKDVEKIFQNHHVVGFSTYGEQFKGIHINQTITGLAIGELRTDSDV
ncbi:FIST C-terminal domain-containing protein [Legionella sp. PATHC035]|uniref:nitric oxide-sensing protein NosP n=1 Tax=Legionella sp. PATHC035 TaxID=2992040 RepID=UPI0022443695|nr:nitric oxide-sensing protein NosP [Legionella sp. PATHC035]MCW8409334.1 FIST C-terminal domain-containing protein [Legionella sp. PATHC035]